MNPPPDTSAAVPSPHATWHEIRPSRGWVGLNMGELWAYRELLFFLVWRDVKVRYKQTVLGASWAILQPLFTMLVFTLFFGILAKMPSDELPYTLFAFSALVPWMFFANALTTSSGSLVESANLIKKVYFPRLVVPIASVLAGVVDFLLAFAALLIMMACYGYAPGLRVLALPAFLLLAFLTALGVGVWMSALNVQFRDVRFTIPFLAQIWMYCTPIVYPSSLLDEPWRTVYCLNPMVGVVEGFRWALLGTETEVGSMVWVSAVCAVLLLGSGLFYFRRLEKNFADVV